MEQGKEVSIIIPVFNEEQAINKTLNDIENVMNSSGYIYELVVVNDGSTDNTEEILKENRIKVNLITHHRNKGYGAAIKTGISYSKYNLILIIDADGTYPNKEIPKLLEQMPKYDMVVGARIGKSVKIPAIRKPVKWLLSTLANYLTATKIPDLNSGLRVFKKGIALKYFHLLPSSFSFTTTITLAMINDGYFIGYIPVDYYQRKGKSKIHPIKDTVSFLLLILRTIIYFNPLKFFLPISFFLFLIAIFVFLYSKFFTPKVMDITIIVIIMGAIQIATLGLLADLIDRRTSK